ncbi:hypothetical protein B0I37DRAFT_75805 [Chaetomium sp. MPI-CAGE-AT-0009]|nr:hypothetical protein B0I37DRAFT_75805 [Chaetomium sp. MPI-CAGE-AT-0009]
MSEVCVSWWVGCEQESQAATVHCGCCRRLLGRRSNYTFQSASLTSGVLVQLSIPDGVEVASSRSARLCSCLAEVTSHHNSGGRRKKYRLRNGQTPGGSNGSAVVSGKGEEKRAEKTDRFGVVRCQRLARIIGVLLRSSRPTAETREGCSTLAVVSTGCGKVHANCGNGGDASTGQQVATNSSRAQSSGRTRRTGHQEDVTQPATSHR